jgi:hypothetical protein
MVVAKGWWSADQAVAWIAYGEANPTASWMEMPGELWSRNWGFNPPDELLSALRARAGRQPWRPERPPVRWPRHYYRAVARRLVRETGEDAAALVDLLEADLARRADTEAAVADAQAELVTAVADGPLEAWGVRLDFHGNPVGEGVPERIKPEVFRGGNRTITPGGTVELPPGEDGHTPLGDIFNRTRPRWGEITFAAADVMRLWPRGEQAAASPSGPVQTPCASAAPPYAALPSPPEGASPQATSPKKRAGGLNYDAKDAPLLAEMKELLDKREVETVHAAARHVAPKAAGSMQGDSKAKRLATKFLTKHPSYRTETLS